MKASWREHQVQSIIRLSDSTSEAQQVLLLKQKMLRAIMEVKMCQIALQDVGSSSSSLASDTASRASCKSTLPFNYHAVSDSNQTILCICMSCMKKKMKTRTMRIRTRTVIELIFIFIIHVLRAALLCDCTNRWPHS